MKVIRIFCCLVFLQAVSGCASVFSNSLSSEYQTGYVYSGVTMDAIAIKCVWVMPYMAKKEEGTSYFLSIPVALLGTGVFLVDLPFSAVADTLYLPVDLAVEPKKERWSIFQSCDNESDGSDGTMF